MAKGGAGSSSGKRGEYTVGVRPDGAEIEDTKSDNGHQWVDEEHGPPQVA